MRPKLHRRYELLAEIRKDPRASIRELCDVMGIRAPSQVHGLLRELEEEGLIVREPRLARSIQIGGARQPRNEMKARHHSMKEKNVERKRDEGWRNQKQTEAQLKAAIERVVRKAQTYEAAGVDVVHDYRHRMSGTMKAVKIG